MCGSVVTQNIKFNLLYWVKLPLNSSQQWIPPTHTHTHSPFFLLLTQWGNKQMSDKEWFATSKTFKINQALVSRCVGCVCVCVLQRIGWAPLIQLNYIHVCLTATFSAVIIARAMQGLQQPAQCPHNQQPALCACAGFCVYVQAHTCVS